MDDHDCVMDGNSDGDDNNWDVDGDEWVSIEYNHITMALSSGTVQQWIDRWVMKMLLSLSLSVSHIHTLSLCMGLRLCYAMRRTEKGDRKEDVMGIGRL
jgi:hypothetical protein